MPGRWRVTWELRAADGHSERFTRELVAPGPPGSQRQGRLSLRAAFVAPATGALAVPALGGLALGAPLQVWGYLRLRPARFFAGPVVSALAPGCSTARPGIDAHPTTFVPNPRPDAAEVRERGRLVDKANCAVCHGPEGEGDGPSAPGMVPPPAGLTGVHARLLGDGDLFWWVADGIEGTAVSGFAATLSEGERWAVISLHPPPRRAGGRRLLDHAAGRGPGRRRRAPRAGAVPDPPGVIGPPLVRRGR